MTRITEKGAYKSITFIIDDENSDISYAGRTERERENHGGKEEGGMKRKMHI